MVKQFKLGSGTDATERPVMLMTPETKSDQRVNKLRLSEPTSRAAREEPALSQP